jgi:hypothetical protein
LSSISAYVKPTYNYFGHDYTGKVAVKLTSVCSLSMHTKIGRCLKITWIIINSRDQNEGDFCKNTKPAKGNGFGTMIFKVRPRHNDPSGNRFAILAVVRACVAYESFSTPLPEYEKHINHFGTMVIKVTL